MYNHFVLVVVGELLKRLQSAKIRLREMQWNRKYFSHSKNWNDGLNAALEPMVILCRSERLSGRPLFSLFWGRLLIGNFLNFQPLASRTNCYGIQQFWGLYTLWLCIVQAAEMRWNIIISLTNPTFFFWLSPACLAVITMPSL